MITKRPDSTKGSARVLDDASRLTPAMPAGDGWIDVGFAAVADGGFRSVSAVETGELDIFSYDVVLRCQTQHIDCRDDNSMELRRIGHIRTERLPDFAVTTGPSLRVADFSADPVNRDLSFGDPPPFTNSRKARLVLFQGADGRTHLRLFDGRPGSASFQGATPAEARRIIIADIGYEWGCFLDGGGTAKLWVVQEGALTSYGNRHYLRWPEQDAGEFTWVPDSGRPASSFLTLQPKRGRLLDSPDQNLVKGLDSSLADAFRVAGLGNPSWNESSPAVMSGLAPQAPPREARGRSRYLSR